MSSLLNINRLEIYKWTWSLKLEDVKVLDINGYKVKIIVQDFLHNNSIIWLITHYIHICMLKSLKDSKCFKMNKATQSLNN